MENTFKNNLTTLKESIQDEDKLVTYISLSKDLCIHVNEAKRLLDYVVEDMRKVEPKTKLFVCYIISGLLRDNNACTTVCSESDLDVMRKKLITIFYEHVYCVSKSMQAVDNCALTAINKFEDFSLCTGFIKANSCIKRANEEILNLKSSVNHASVDDIEIPKKTEKKKEFFKNSTASAKKNVEVKDESLTKSKTPSPKKEIVSKTGNKNGAKPTSKGIAGFFNKTNGDVSKAKQTKVSDEKLDNKVAIKVEKEIKLEQPKPSNASKTIEKVELTEKSKKKAKTEKHNNSLQQIKKNGKVDKKRKRLLHVSDSESETEGNDPFGDDEDIKMEVNNDSEDEIPPTPSISTVKITSGIINPTKRRKVVDKTYTDEDGYILTKKEEVYESCSDNEEERKADVIQEKENVKITQVKAETSPKKFVSAKKKKVSPPQKGKQQTLTNFFKRV